MLRSNRQLSHLALVMGFALSAAACQTTRAVVETTPEQQTTFLSGFSENLQEAFRPVMTEGPQNEVLHYMNAGTLAFELGEWDSATEAFDRALLRIESIYANNEIAEQARSNFTPEDYKDFRGEPHERMMAYYYRGLLYLHVGDYENARASFRSGLLQDSFTVEEEFAQDSALMAYLVGWASRCNGDMDSAAEAFAEAAKYRPSVVPPAAEDDIIALAEVGYGPSKQALGEYQEFLRHIPNQTYAEEMATFHVNGQHMETIELEDIAYQATTRGGREVDLLLQGKAQFKEDADDTGDALLAVGIATMLLEDNNPDVAAVGGVVALAGAVAKGVAAATTPEADTRTWHNLPGEVQYTTLRSADVDTSGEITVGFADENGVEISPLKTTARLLGADQACRILWATSRSKTYEVTDELLY